MILKKPFRGLQEGRREIKNESGANSVMWLGKSIRVVVGHRVVHGYFPKIFCPNAVSRAFRQEDAEPRAVQAGNCQDFISAKTRLHYRTLPFDSFRLHSREELRRTQSQLVDKINQRVRWTDFSNHRTYL